MNFKIANFIYSLISLSVALFFIFIGLISFMLPWFPAVREALSNFILNDSVMIFLFGFCLLVMGIAYISAFFLGMRRRYYTIKSGPKTIAVSESIFNDYLENYWEQVFPNKQIPHSVQLKGNRVQVTADLPFIPLEDQKDLIQKLEHDVTEIFTNLLGYRAEYQFSISFNEE